MEDRYFVLCKGPVRILTELEMSPCSKTLYVLTNNRRKAYVRLIDSWKPTPIDNFWLSLRHCRSSQQFLSSCYDYRTEQAAVTGAVLPEADASGSFVCLDPCDSAQTTVGYSQRAARTVCVQIIIDFLVKLRRQVWSCCSLLARLAWIEGWWRLHLVLSLHSLSELIELWQRLCRDNCSINTRSSLLL